MMRSDGLRSLPFLCGVLALAVPVGTVRGQVNPLDGGGAHAVEETGEDAGLPMVFEGDGLRVIIERMDEESGDTTGKLVLNGSAFPFSGRFDDEDVFHGTFTANGQGFPFTATTNEQDEVLFRTGQSQYRLRAAAPGAAPSQPDNPLSQRPVQPPNPMDRRHGATPDNPMSGPGGRQQPPPGAGTAAAGPNRQILMDAAQAYFSQDYAKAAQIVEPLAQRGHVGAAFLMGVMSAFGQGRPEDAGAAIRYYEQAVSGQHMGAMYNLGVHHREGRGVPADPQRAIELIGAAARLGDVMAMSDYGFMLMNAHGAPQNMVEGLAWVQVAANRGHDGARQHLQGMQNDTRITPDHWQQARTRVTALDGTLPPADQLPDYVVGFDRLAAAHSGGQPPPSYGGFGPGGGEHRSTPPPSPPPSPNGTRSTSEPPPGSGQSGMTASQGLGTVRLQRRQVHDPGMGNIVCYTVLVPDDWQVEDTGVLWVPQLKPGYYPKLEASGPHGMEVSSIQGMFYTWTEVSAELQNYMQMQGTAPPQPGTPQSDGSIYLAPPRDAQHYVVDYLLPQGRPQATDVRVESVAVEHGIQQALQQAWAMNIQQAQQMNQIMGGREQILISADRVTLTYDENGRRYKEQVIVPMVRQVMPMEQMTSTFWTTGALTATRAPVEMFDQAVPLFTTIATSVQFTPEWTGRILELQKQISQIEAQGRQIAQQEFEKRQRIIAQSNDDVARIHSETIASQNAAQDRMHQANINAIREVDDYRLPGGGTASLPSHYDRVFTDGTGGYILTNDSFLDPGQQFNGNWQQIQRAGP